jgi:hypothetical protein
MKYDKNSAILREDSQGIVHNIPNARLEKWRINSFGFRGKEIDLGKKKGQIRVMCLGGSETFGVYECEGREWPAQLGEMLRDQYPGVEVINISVIGLHAKTRKEYIEKYILSLQPDILVMYHHRFLTHIKDSIRGIENNFFPGQSNENIKTYSKSRILFHRLLSEYDKMIAVILPKWLLNHIQMRRLHKKIKRKEKEYLHNKKPLNKVPEQIILKYEQDLNSFVDYLKEKNIVPVLSTFPALTTFSNKDIHKNILKGTRYLFCIELSENGILDATRELNDLIKRTAEKQYILCIDNDNLLRKTLEYFADNFHYTNRGSEVIAKNICEALFQSNLLGKRS